MKKICTCHYMLKIIYVNRLTKFNRSAGIKIKRWTKFIIAGVWNHLMRISIPLAINRINKLFNAEIIMIKIFCK